MSLEKEAIDCTEMAERLRADLKELGNFVVEAGPSCLSASVAINGREYALAQKVHDTDIDYAPIFRGWFAQLKDTVTI